jgi:hypothetical protein
MSTKRIVNFSRGVYIHANTSHQSTQAHACTRNARAHKHALSHIHKHTHTHINTMDTHTCIHPHNRAHILKHKYTYTHTHSSLSHTHTHTNTHTHTHPGTHTYTHTFAHTSTPILQSRVEFGRLLVDDGPLLTLSHTSELRLTCHADDHTPSCVQIQKCDYRAASTIPCH